MDSVTHDLLYRGRYPEHCGRAELLHALPIHHWRQFDLRIYRPFPPKISLQSLSTSVFHQAAYQVLTFRFRKVQQDHHTAHRVQTYKQQIIPPPNIHKARWGSLREHDVCEPIRARRDACSQSTRASGEDLGCEDPRDGAEAEGEDDADKEDDGNTGSLGRGVGGGIVRGWREGGEDSGEDGEGGNEECGAENEGLFASDTVSEKGNEAVVWTFELKRNVISEMCGRTSRSQRLRYRCKSPVVGVLVQS